ncbi:MAG: transposase [Fimbriimonadaceae bacterium]|nr:transposase [Fimbriimonadaceae bacterium]QYK57356.1 MAG: transposase [Fimbriimonadaceae bacterium]
MRQRHYRNHGQAGQAVFVTTACLDFVPLFASDRRRIMMARWLVDDLRRYGSLLHAFVIMPEHLHWVCTVPTDRDVSWLVNRIKANSGKALSRDLTPNELVALSQQFGLNRRTVWQRSFRSLPLDRDRLVAQKCEYIHLNPVRRRLSSCPFSYYASSARFHEFGTWADDFALPSDVGAILDCRWPWP